ncbi:uncharacterized protein LOC136030178 [Artemia franciscana]|uniref:Centromere protein L n=1 Tax=Artemia franciscana TaxID=6661 RepID=A0AA88HH19_ARTSF|nr:hypothetical protein QYM36_015763 [Artemia franciscana]
MKKSKNSSRLSEFNMTVIQRKNIDSSVARDIHISLRKYAWTPFRVGILTNFDFSPSFLKRYRRYINAKIGLPDVKVNIESIYSLGGENQGTPCIRISVLKTFIDEKIICECWLFGLSSSIEDKLHENEVNAPLLLMRGQKNIFENLKNLLQSMFSTPIHQMAPNMKSLVFMCVKKNPSKNIVFYLAKEKQQLVFHMNGDTLAGIVEAISDKSVSTDHFDEESEFYERIYAHVKCTLHLNLEVWQVKAIKSSDFCVDEEGKVKMMSYNVFETIIPELIDIAETRISAGLERI